MLTEYGASWQFGIDDGTAADDSAFKAKHGKAVLRQPVEVSQAGPYAIAGSPTAADL